MNYVGCKVINAIYDNIQIQQFYMNYVGCKAGGQAYIVRSLSEFYMNYVGCKVWLYREIQKYPRVLYELCGM